MSIHEGYDDRTPVTRHQGLAAHQFAEEFEAMGPGRVLNVASGGTNLQSDIKDLLPDSDIEVVSLDPDYNNSENWFYQNIPNRQVGIAQDLPFDDDSFSLTLCQFGIQHMPKEDVPTVLKEMVRVTKPVDEPLDPRAGTILLGPVFKDKVLEKYIYDNGLEDVCGIETPSNYVQENWRPSGKPTLIIKKVPQLSAEKLAKISAGLIETKAIYPKRKSLGELVSRATHGFSQV